MKGGQCLRRRCRTSVGLVLEDDKFHWTGHSPSVTLLRASLGSWGMGKGRQLGEGSRGTSDLRGGQAVKCPLKTYYVEATPSNRCGVRGVGHDQSWVLPKEEMSKGGQGSAARVSPGLGDGEHLGDAETGQTGEEGLQST